MADLEGVSSNAFFEVLEEWNAVLEAERHLLELALQDEDTCSDLGSDSGDEPGPTSSDNPPSASHRERKAPRRAARKVSPHNGGLGNGGMGQ